MDRAVEPPPPVPSPTSKAAVIRDGLLKRRDTER